MVVLGWVVVLVVSVVVGGVGSVLGFEGGMIEADVGFDVESSEVVAPCVGSRSVINSIFVVGISMTSDPEPSPFKSSDSESS